jgi:1-(5-phosphoribosyl)-5-[(5-phosphoribosylamino)methylideneamino] imidazole-4-carboxamide isomerase (EC 5.3.1.16)
MLLIPAIDLKEGKCVRLRQGRMDDNTIFSDDPVAVAGKWVAAAQKESIWSTWMARLPENQEMPT